MSILASYVFASISQCVHLNALLHLRILTNCLQKKELTRFENHSKWHLILLGWVSCSILVRCLVGILFFKILVSICQERSMERLCRHYSGRIDYKNATHNVQFNALCSPFTMNFVAISLFFLELSAWFYFFSC